MRGSLKNNAQLSNRDFVDYFLKQSPQPIFLLNSAGTVLNCNEHLLSLYSLTHSELIQHNYFTQCQLHHIETPFSSKELLVNQVPPNTPYLSSHASKMFQWSISQLIIDHCETFFIIGHDVTHIMSNNKEQILRDTMIDHLPAQVFWKNSDLVYLGCNTAFINSLGLSSKYDVIGKTDFDLPVSKIDSEAYRADDLSVIQSKQPKLNIDERQILSDGTERLLSTNKVPLLDDKGVVYGVLAVYIDITKRKQLEEALIEANDTKDEFIQNMSHDIRTPLTGIIGMSNIIEHDSQSAKEKEHAHLINISGKQLLNLLNSVLDIVSIGSSKENAVNEEPLNIYQLIQDICELELPTIKVKKLELLANIDPDVPQWIKSDPIKLHRIMLNLLGNAIKFTTEGHIKIHVSCKEKSNKHILLQFQISDSGIGISKQEQIKIFDRFYRATPSYKGHYSGNGVGLHIVQKYIEILNGTIILNSEEHKGTTFIVEIPVGIEPNHASESVIKIISSSSFNDIEKDTSNNSLDAQSRQKPLLLLVEDNAIALKMIESIVKKMNCRYISAMTGEKALTLFKVHSFDLMITDIGLPGISGNELTATIRAYEKETHQIPLPIVGLTAHAMTVVQQESLKVGMNKVIAKPIRFEIMNDLLNELIPSKSKCSLPIQESPLGFDLPATEEDLFQLSLYPLLDEQNGIFNLGDRNTLKTLLQLMIKQTLPDEMNALEKAYAEKNWLHIEQLAHKIKSGAVYCGTIRLKMACQYLERYHKAGHTLLLHKLFIQLKSVIAQSIKAISEWL